MTEKTTDIGYLNRNKQKVLFKTDFEGNDHNQKLYVLECQKCNQQYGANGSDIFQRKCPDCMDGRAGLLYTNIENEKERAIFKETILHIINSTEFKPGLFGINVDLKKLFKID